MEWVRVSAKQTGRRLRGPVDGAAMSARPEAAGRSVIRQEAGTRRKRVKVKRRAAVSAAHGRRRRAKRAVPSGRPKASRTGTAAGRRPRRRTAAPASPLLKRPPRQLRMGSRADGPSRRWGEQDAAGSMGLAEPELRQRLNACWAARVRQLGLADSGAQALGARYHSMARSYLVGYFRALGRRAPDWVPLPTPKSVAVIITAKNEADTISRVLAEVNRLMVSETYVIVNGSTDGSAARARHASQAVVVSCPEALGHDVGRSLGAKLARADILLFLDGDIPVPAEELVSFVWGVESGLDVALNDITPYLGSFPRQDGVSVMKQFLNLGLNRPELAASSLTAIPHALSRRTVETLGAGALSVPPKAQALAILSGLKVAAAGRVNVIRGNKRRRTNRGRSSPVAGLILGDHIEALRRAGDTAGVRLFYEDTLRKRDYAGGGE
ncbi:MULTISPECIES: glycosyltransferase family 2 protein [Paenibacillus]|uniref:glycosyltransferase family 2 protein n=1 Tax=Paenibacillus TaxID=44249 RepID=UPI0022B8E775|nr:glycosyltransferase [Paenibacillus caseinilyticus]MCZ8519163.1 glycosyltransferase [Paenibacillus caseinilyticus]